MYKLNENDISRFELLQEDILNVNFSDATHIYMYLTEPGIEEIEPLLNKYVSNNTRIVSCDYPITNWKHISCERVWGLFNQNFFKFFFLVTLAKMVTRLVA